MDLNDLATIAWLCCWTYKSADWGSARRRDSKIHNPKSEIRNPQSKTQDKIWFRGFGLGFWIDLFLFWILDLRVGRAKLHQKMARWEPFSRHRSHNSKLLRNKLWGRFNCVPQTELSGSVRKPVKNTVFWKGAQNTLKIAGLLGSCNSMRKLHERRLQTEWTGIEHYMIFMHNKDTKRQVANWGDKWMRTKILWPLPQPRQTHLGCIESPNKKLFGKRLVIWNSPLRFRRLWKQFLGWF